MPLKFVEDSLKKQYVFRIDFETNIPTLLVQKGKLIAIRTEPGLDWEILDNTPLATIYRGLTNGSPIKVNIDHETWIDMISNNVKGYREKGFQNNPRLKVTVKSGLNLDISKLQETSTGKLFTERITDCKLCSANRIVGKVFYHTRKTGSGLEVIGQGSFKPNDPKARRYKPKSKAFICAECSVKEIKGPGLPKLDSVLKEIEAFLHPSSSVTADFARGANYAVLKLRKFLVQTKGD